MTSNLNAQVQRSNNIVSSVSLLIVNSDDLVQGLKRHWLLRSAFKKKEESPKPKTVAAAQCDTEARGARVGEVPAR